MTRDEAVAQIKFDLGNRQGTDLDAQIILKLQQSQRLLEQGKSLPFFLKHEDQTLTIPSGDDEVAFPTGFLREVQDETFHYFDTVNDTEVFLEKVDLRNGNVTFADSDDGRPRAYAIRESSFKFFPAADIDYDLLWTYYKSATLLDTNAADNAWLVNSPDILIGHAGSAIAEIIGHDRAKVRFDALLSKAWSAAFAEGILREEENFPMAVGSMT